MRRAPEDCLRDILDAIAAIRGYTSGGRQAFESSATVRDAVVASSGVGTIVQMAAELFKQQAGADLLVVPFKGGQPATMALLSGEVDMIINDLTTLKSNLASGKLHALAVATRAGSNRCPTCRPSPSSACPAWSRAPAGTSACR
jgi:tripartite-type tricarboxylate transporter receptor subunit TctC